MPLCEDIILGIIEALGRVGDSWPLRHVGERSVDYPAEFKVGGRVSQPGF